MKTRILTGIAMFLVVAGAVAVRFWSTLIFSACVLALTIFSVLEICKAYKIQKKQIVEPVAWIYPCVLWAIYFVVKSPSRQVLYQILALLLVFCGLFAFELIFMKSKKYAELSKNDPEILENKNLLQYTLNTMSILIYPTTLLATLFGINSFSVHDGFIAILLVLGISCFTDTFALFFGCWLKGKRLCPSISPKKGVPGMIFGMIGGIFASAICFVAFYVFKWFDSSLLNLSFISAFSLFLIAGLVGTFLTQFGDLLASSIKRKSNIKDFGHLFPGHGGFMDRVDGLMFNSALIYILFILFI